MPILDLGAKIQQRGVNVRLAGEVSGADRGRQATGYLPVRGGQHGMISPQIRRQIPGIIVIALGLEQRLLEILFVVLILKGIGGQHLSPVAIEPRRHGRKHRGIQSPG